MYSAVVPAHEDCCELGVEAISYQRPRYRVGSTDSTVVLPSVAKGAKDGSTDSEDVSLVSGDVQARCRKKRGFIFNLIK